MYYELFPLEYRLLQEELMTGYHPRLEVILSAHAAEDIDMKLAQIAAYCGVGLDGVFTLEERIKLCAMFLAILKEKRENPNTDVLVVQDFSAFVQNPKTVVTISTTETEGVNENANTRSATNNAPDTGAGRDVE